MHFDFITVYVADMEASIRFYNGLLGLEVLRRHPIEDGELAFLGVDGQPTIEIISGPAFADNTYNGFSIGIAVPSLDDATKRMEENGYPLVRGPISPNPSARFSYFRDPHGIEVQLIEHIPH
ncbi:VOC family protein [Ruminococcaceae bacterium OttesenSCG-928-L11]|nr:VOC family protein [Ruminococcaceae bacterium OttesenSCG-928-L11]